MMAIRRRVLMGSRKKKRLPDEYQQVEWIEGTKNQQLIIPVPGISDNETFTAVLDSQTVSILSGTNVFISATALAGAGTWMGLISSQMAIGAGIYFSTAPTTRCVKTIVFSNAQITATIGEETYSRVTDVHKPETMLRVFRTPSYYSDTKVYSLKIYDTNNVLIRDLIPCYRISDSEIGMYDLVSQNFFTNSGTGTFSKGNDVN